MNQLVIQISLAKKYMDLVESSTFFCPVENTKMATITDAILFRGKVLRELNSMAI